MIEQNYSNHRRFIPGCHFFICPLMVLYFLGSVVYFVKHLLLGDEWLISILTFFSGIIFLLIFVYMRKFVTLVQDRAIRAEENLRHFVISGKLLGPELKMTQVIALRFASDEEIIELSGRAVAENLSNDDIKRAIKNWKPDFDRV